MKFRTLLALVLAALSVSACVVEPFGGRGGYGAGHYEDHDNGRRVWH